MSSGAVVSGLGFVGAVGCGRAALADALHRGVPKAKALEPFDGLHPKGLGLKAALARDEDLAPWLSARQARRMSPPSKFAVAAARMALEDAGLETEALEADLGVVLATSFGPSSFTEGLLEQILQQGPATASPLLFTESVANAPAAQTALALRARGANVTITQRETGPLLALARGAAEVARGRLRCALVLAVDEITPLLHGVLHRFGSLTTAGEGGIPRPFDRRRDGYLVAESAAVAVLEPAAEARRRGARVLARVGAVVRGFDPGASRTGWGHDPAPLAATLTRGLERAGLTPADFDRVISGAAGTPAGDLLEARVLRRVWDAAPLPPVLVPKAVTGEHGGGFLASALLAAGGFPFGAPVGFVEEDPELAIVPHDGRSLPPPRRLLATSLAPGGAAAWVVLEAPDQG